MVSEIELLSAVSTRPFEACEGEWRKLLSSLSLGLSFVPAVDAVIREGRWRTQPNPIAYVRKSAGRCAVRMGIVDIRPNHHREILASDLQMQDEDGESCTHDDKLGTALHRYEQSFGADIGSGYD